MTPTDLIIDIEASGLDADAWPIEIAWASIDRAPQSLRLDPTGVDGWRHWCPFAEEVHGISRAELVRSGMQPVLAFDRLLVAWQGCRLHSNAPLRDGSWLLAFHRIPCITEVPWVVEDLQQLLPGIDEIHWQDLVDAARAMDAPDHSASQDVRFQCRILHLAGQRFAWLDAD